MYVCLLLVAYGICVDYSTADTDTTMRAYSMYQDVHVMILIGFGFLMTAVPSYSVSALAWTLLLTSICIPTSILTNGWLHMLVSGHWERVIHVNLHSLIMGDFATGAVLVSTGAVLGRVTPLQLCLIAICELVWYALNESLCVLVYQAVDMGGSMYVHLFGAYFGLAVSRTMALHTASPGRDTRIVPTTPSMVSSFLGTLFLWMFWPSFNGALASGSAQHRVILNTCLALASSSLVTFAVSRLISVRRGTHHFHVADLQNAVLAGGVAIGSSSDLVVSPVVALVLGAMAAILCIWCHHTVSPWMERAWHVTDVFGVQGLHGLPGILGGLGGVVTCLLVQPVVYDQPVGDLFPAMSDGQRSAYQQAGFQAAALITSLTLAMVGGACTGTWLRHCVSGGTVHRSPTHVAQDATELDV